MGNRIIFIVFSLLVSVGVFASNTSVINADNKEIWYDFDSEAQTARVVYKGDSFDSYDNEYCGEIVIPSSVVYNGTEYKVTSIGEKAFSSCGLTSITLPKSLILVSLSAFYGCDRLENVFYEGSIADWCNITYLDNYSYPLRYAKSLYINGKDVVDVVISNEVETISRGCFAFCEKLKSVVIQDEVNAIGNVAFYSCINLESVVIGNGITRIGKRSFTDCVSLTSITIGESVKCIEEQAFYKCKNVASITCKSVTPPEVEINAFNGIDTTIPIYVPSESVELYKKSPGWQEFSNIQSMSTNWLPIVIVVIVLVIVCAFVVTKHTNRRRKSMTIVVYKGPYKPFNL